MDLMNSLDADGNGEGESDLGDLERRLWGRAKFIRVYVGSPL